MTKVNLSINEIINMINICGSIPKTKGELLETICTLEPNYKKQISQLIYLNINTLTYLIYILIESKYRNKAHIRDIVLTEDIVYY